MNIARFRKLNPGHPLANIFALLQEEEGPTRDLATTKGMAAGMVVLLAHQNQLSGNDAIELLAEIGPQASAPANNTAPGALH